MQKQEYWSITPANWSAVWFVVVFLSLGASVCHAHPPGLSSVDVALNANQVQVKITFALQDIEAFTPMDTDLDAEVSDAERDAAKPQIAKLVEAQLNVAIDGKNQSPMQAGLVSFDGQNNAHVEFVFAGAAKQELSLESKFLAMLPKDHQQFLTIRATDGKTLAEKMLTQQQNRISLTVSPSGQSSAGSGGSFDTFSDFFKLGVEHIVTGYDHLLFLFALLMVTREFWAAIKIITFFTIAHSITLALAGLDIVNLASNIVEPLIALSIIYVGLENIIQGDNPKGRQLLTFSFGLVHGFGFAGVLREMGISSGETGIVVPLLSFNLGIETGQICIAALVLPLIWLTFKRLASFRGKIIPIGSGLVSLMGLYWLLERTVL